MFRIAIATAIASTTRCSRTGPKDDRLSVEVILNRPTLQRHLDAFLRLGGQVRHVFAAVSYGWTGSIAQADLRTFARRTGRRSSPRRCAEADCAVSRRGDAHRPGAPDLGLQLRGADVGRVGQREHHHRHSNANITIAILDTGVDGTHSDLSGRMVAWKDYTSDGDATASDVIGHGTHVASIALGSGAAFGLGPGTLQYTNSGTLSGVGAGSFLPAVIHTPNYFGGNSTLTVSSSATFVGGAATTFYQVTSSDPNGTWGFFSSATGTSPRSGSGSVPNSAARYSDALLQSSPAGFDELRGREQRGQLPGRRRRLQCAPRRGTELQMVRRESVQATQAPAPAQTSARRSTIWWRIAPRTTSKSST